jgi:hypothetical protein
MIDDCDAGNGRVDNADARISKDLVEVQSRLSDNTCHWPHPLTFLLF